MCDANVFIPAEEVEAFLEAALNGNTTEVATMLNRRWYLIDVPSDDNDTALMLATWNGNVDTMDMLCQHHASTFSTNDEDENVFDQIPSLDEEKILRMNKILHKAREEEMESWRDPNRQYNRVTYEWNHKEIEGGVWCSFKMGNSLSERVTEMEGGETNMMVSCP
jgi:hypothetical protein